MIDHLSISQLNLHRDNPRRYCLEYLEGIREPASPSLKFGTVLHLCLETILGNDNDAINLAYVGWDDKTKKVLEEFRSSIEDLTYRLEDRFRVFIDPRLPPIEGCIDMWSFKDNALWVFDHKTVTPGYEETEETLLNNLQLNLYAHVLRSYKDNVKMIIGHNQFFKKRTKDGFAVGSYKIIKKELTLDHNAAIMEEIRQEGVRLMQTVEIYKKFGLDKIPETDHHVMWYGKPCILWPCITGKETIEECRARINKLHGAV